MLEDYCPSCDCDCAGNIFLCSNPNFKQCRMCGHGVKAAWLIAEEKKFNERHAPRSPDPPADDRGRDRKQYEENEPMGLLSGVKPREGTAQSERRPFLRNVDLPKKGKLSVTIEQLRKAPPSMEFSDFLLDIKIGKEKKTVGLKEDAVLLSQLMEDLGSNEVKWKGKKIAFVLAKGKYINLDRANGRATTSTRKGRK